MACKIDLEGCMIDMGFGVRNNRVNLVTSGGGGGRCGV